MQSIWKFSLNLGLRDRINMPKGSIVLCVKTQNDIPCIWALVPDTQAKPTERIFSVYGTGHRHENIKGKYIDTFFLIEESLVFHVFEETETENKNAAILETVD